MTNLRLSLAILVASFAHVSSQEILLDSFHTSGTRATGMGGASLALSDDASGLFHNPAGLARISRPEVTTSLFRSSRNSESEFYGTFARDDVTSTRIGGAGFAFPFPVHRGSLVFGAAYNRRATFDQGIRIDGYDAEVQFHKDGYSRDHGALGEFAFGGAVDVAPGLSMGVTGFVWEGDNRFDQVLTQTDTRDAHVDTVQLFQRFESQDSYEAKGVRVGLAYTHLNGGRLGLTVRSPVRVNVSSRLEDEYVDEFEDGTDVYEPEVFTDRYTYTLPWEVGVGIGWARNGLTLAADAVYADTRRTEYRREPSNIAPNVDDFFTQYREHTRFHLGAEYTLPRQPIRIRAGYFHNPISYIGGDGLPDVDAREERQGITLGGAAELQNALSIDIAVVLNQFRQKEGRREDHVRTTQWFASLSYRFPR